MPIYDIDTTGVKESKGGGGKMCPEGDFKFQIVDFTVGETKSNRDPMITIELQVIEDLTGSKAYEGAKVWDRIVIPLPGSPAEKIMGRTKHFLHCIDEPFDGHIQINPDNWVPRQVYASVYHEEYNGKIRAYVRNYTLQDELPKEPQPAATGQSGDIKWDD